MRTMFVFLLAAIAVALPETVSAQQGLVACSGLDCGTCEFTATARRVFAFLLIIASIVATIMLVYAGLRLTTSGGSTEAKEQAKTILWNIVIGLLFVLGAYAIVNAVMAALLRTDIPMRPWDKVECLHAIIPSSKDVTLGGPGGTKYGLAADLPPVSEQALCNTEYLSSHFPGQERIAQCVLQGESACGAKFYSQTDINVNTNGERVPFSVSPWQINLTVHDIRAGECSSGPIDCSSAYNGTNYAAVLVNTDIYNQCIEALKDPECSGNVAERIQTAGWTQWSAYKANGCGT